MTDFIREVDEEFRHDRARRAFLRYRYVVAGVLAAILVGVGAWKYHENMVAQRAEVASNQYLDALDLARDGKGDDVLSALSAVQASAPPGYQLLARFRIAGETAARDPKAGAGLFDALAADPAVDPSMQAVARLRAALLLVDTLSYAELKVRLDPLADANSPLRNPAREMLALGALKAGDTAEAGRLLDLIETDATAGGSLRQRAETLSGLVRGTGTTAGPSSDAAPATPPAPSP